MKSKEPDSQPRCKLCGSILRSERSIRRGMSWYCYKYASQGYFWESLRPKRKRRAKINEGETNVSVSTSELDGQPPPD